MRICFYSPYLPHHFGGGEKYILDCARLAAQKHQVEVALSGSQDNFSRIKSDYQNFLGQSLEKVKFVSSPLGSDKPWWQKLWWTKQYDVLYYLTDGSLFFSFAKKNILHIQVPLLLDKSGLKERLKLTNWQIRNTNSFFTKSVVEQAWPIRIDQVHQPMIDLEELRPVSLKDKQPIILHIGRFFSNLHSKKQEVMVKMFAQLLKNNPELKEKWRLVLIGTVEDESYADLVHRLAKDLPITFYHHLSRAQVVKWLQKSSIYWHATGVGVDQSQHPEKVEHFGISTAEAMGSGCVPVVINKGGQPEILGPENKSLLWDSTTDCVQITQKLIKNPKLRQQYQQRLLLRSKRFGQKVFAQKLFKMIEG